MMLRDLRVSALILVSALAVACAEEPTEFTGSSTAVAGPAGPGVTSGNGNGGSGGDSGDGGSSAAGDGGDSSSSSPDTSSGDGGSNTTVGSGGAPPQTVDFDLALDDQTPNVDLRSSVSVTLTITENDYVGNVFLSFDELPGDVIASFDEESVALDGEGTTTVGITFETFSDTVSGSLDFTITGTVEEGSSSTIGMLVVRPTITIIIPQDLASFDGDDDAFGPNPTMIAQPPGGISGDNPVTVYFLNSDDVAHEIHADRPDQGFPHSQMSIPAGAMDVTPRQVNATGTYGFYPHDLNNPNIPGTIVIQ